MVFTLALQQEHAAVVGVVISSAFVLTWMGTKVGQARKKYNITYPKMYAESSDAHATEFNCVQRGHQNTVENYPIYLVLQTLSAVEYPLVSAAAGAVYMLGRIAYFNGYCTGDPKKRSQGFFGYLGLFTMLGLAGKFCYTLATSA